MKYARATLLLSIALGLAACHSVPGPCRTWSSAAMGAAIGTVVPVAGTLVGGVSGALVGAETDVYWGESPFCE